jgi:predicted Zn-dependent protease with MMP-like domain
VIDLPRRRFEELVGDAVDGIPVELGALIDNVAVFVVEWGRSTNLLGLYEGVPLTARGDHYGIGGGMPDRITIYRQPICAMCTTEDEVVRQVQVTVIHEVGHHFGLSDSRLHELGWG